MPPKNKNELIRIKVPVDGESISLLDASANGSVVVAALNEKIWIYKSETDSVVISSSKKITAISISAIGDFAIAGTDDGELQYWNLLTLRCEFVVRAHRRMITSISISWSSNRVVSSSFDRITKSWMLPGIVCTKIWCGHTRPVHSVATNSNGFLTVSGSSDFSVRVWRLDGWEESAVLRWHAKTVNSLAMSASGRRFVSGAADGTICMWDLHKTHGRYVGELEGHTDAVNSVSISFDGTKLASASSDGSVRYWDLESGQFALCPLNGTSGGVAVLSKDGSCLVTTDDTGQTLVVWRSPETESEVSTYTNAKVVLVGESGVGKTAIAIRLSQDEFTPTISSDAHWATQLKIPENPTTNRRDREIWLWDFAGQSDYKLIHQLFMDETALAVFVFNPQSDEPFLKLSEWNRDITGSARRDFRKILVAARCDRGGVIANTQVLDEFMRENGFEAFLETSALTGTGCKELRDAIVSLIDWESIPWTISPKIFSLLKDQILQLKDEGAVLFRMGELKREIETRLSPISFSAAQLEEVIRLLMARGLVWKLEFGDFVLLDPACMNRYASVVIRQIRKQANQLGSIEEDAVLSCRLNFEGIDRLPSGDEEIVIRAMHQTFVNRGLCFRAPTDQGTQLVFPTCFKREMPKNPGHPPVTVSYDFIGSVDEIYATLVVQLFHTKSFSKGDLWHFAADFRTSLGQLLGFEIVVLPNAAARLSVFCDKEISADAIVTFIKFIDEHIRNHAKSVKRIRHYICRNCGYSLRDSELALELLQEHGQTASIICQKCREEIKLWDTIEQKFASEEFINRVRELEDIANASIDNESRELILVGEAQAIVFQAGQIYRGYTNSDHGIDGEIEFKDANGQATGIRRYLQLKSGDSHLRRRKRDGVELFQIKKARWIHYWKKQSYPVLLVVRTSNGVIRFIDVSACLKDITPTSDGMPTFSWSM